MKPERIQLMATLYQPNWGVFQTFDFDSLRKAAAFSTFVDEMAENHGVEASCLTDPLHRQVVVLARIEDPERPIAAEVFLETVADIYLDWISPDEES